MLPSVLAFLQRQAMHRQTVKLNALAILLLTAGAGLGQTPDLSSSAARMYSIVKKARPGELKWQEIPWLVDLQDGVRLAKDEHRPLLLWVSGDDPLERC